MICSGLEVLGVELDRKANKVRGKSAVISTHDSNVIVLVIPTDEELMIARETTRLISE